MLKQVDHVHVGYTSVYVGIRAWM